MPHNYMEGDNRLTLQNYRFLNIHFHVAKVFLTQRDFNNVAAKKGCSLKELRHAGKFIVDFKDFYTESRFPFIWAQK